MSSLDHINRRGDCYYVLEGKTKTGKPKYYCSKKPQGVQVERLPQGFEIYEHPRDGLVSIRRIRPTPILPIEREMLTRWVEEYTSGLPTIVEVEDDTLVVYSSDINPEQSSRLLSQGNRIKHCRQALVLPLLLPKSFAAVHLSVSSHSEKWMPRISHHASV